MNLNHEYIYVNKATTVKEYFLAALYQKYVPLGCKYEESESIE